MPRPALSITLTFALSASLLGCSETTQPNVERPSPTFFVYAANSGQAPSGSISGFSGTESTGLLTPLSGFPLSLSDASTPTVLTHDPQNRFLIAVDSAFRLHVLTVNPMSGALSEVSTSPTASIGAVAVATDPSGNFVYIATDFNVIVAFSLDNTGTLTQVGSPVVLGVPKAPYFKGNGVNALHVSADGRFLYLDTDFYSAVYSVDASDGTVTQIQRFQNTSDNSGLVFDPAGAYAYAVGDGVLLAYSVDASTGILTLAQQSTPQVETDGNSTLTIAPNGKFAYTIENGNSLVSYSVANGVLTPIGAPLTGLNSNQLLIDSTSSFLYAPQDCLNCAGQTSSAINAYAIGSNGLLSPLFPATVPSGAAPFGITLISK